MLVFSTRLPLKKEIEYFDCIKLFMKWVIESPNYPIDNMEYEEESLEDFDYTKDNVTFSIRHYNNSQVQICACRLENKEANPKVGENERIDVFKNVSISGDEGIPINKRGSGVKRLNLLNFFRAEAERRMVILFRNRLL